MKRCLLLFLVALLTGCVSSAAQQDLFSNAVSSRATADAALKQAQFQEQFLTATAEAPIIRITETAAGLSVQATQAAGTSMAGITTQTASFAQTAAWWTPTPDATQTKVFVDLEAEKQIIANNLERDRLELERQQTMNDFNAKVVAYSWVIVVLVLVLALMLVVRKWRYQAAKVDARGNVIPLLDIVGGTYTDPDRNPNYRGDLSEDTVKELFLLYLEKKFGLKAKLPQLTAERQDATTERDQMIDMATRGLLPETASEARDRKKQVGQQAMKQLTGPTLQSRFKVLNDGSNLDVIDGQIIQVLDADWQEQK